MNMNKKIIALVGLIALGVGGTSAAALKSHAQAAVQPTTAVTPVVTTSGEADVIQQTKGTDTNVEAKGENTGVETADGNAETKPDALDAGHADPPGADVNNESGGAD